MTWSSLGLSLIDSCWLFLALCFLVAFSVHKASAQLPREYRKSSLFTLFQDLIRYGKTKQNLHRAEWLRVFDVPKRWFWHFYAISVCWNVFLLLLSFNLIYQLQSYPPWLTGMLEILTGVPSSFGQAPQLSTVLVQLLLCVHSLRRLLECLFVSVFSDGAMHLVQYLFGLGYYIVLGLTVLCSDLTAKGHGTLLSCSDWIRAAGFVLFIAASLLQHHSMVLLAELRKGKSGQFISDGVYLTLPTTDTSKQTEETLGEGKTQLLYLLCPLIKNFHLNINILIHFHFFSNVLQPSLHKVLIAKYIFNLLKYCLLKQRIVRYTFSLHAVSYITKIAALIHTGESKGVRQGTAYP
uniref:Polyprenal reductase n=1 Tax=Poecilia reticulata TaxID=8081 RepID=A0A3P9Q5A3_POERE